MTRRLTQTQLDEHRHRYTPGPMTSNGPPVRLTTFSCRCGARVNMTPGIRTRDWRWKWLSWNGLKREWHKARRVY